MLPYYFYPAGPRPYVKFEEMPHFRICNDTTFQIWDFLEDAPKVTRGQKCPSSFNQGPWTIYLRMLKLMKAWGWVLTDQAYCRRHAKCLNQTHHAGAKGKLRFNSSISPGLGAQFEFYEDVPRDNPNGGKYGFNKLQRMPYLDRLRLLATFNRMKNYLGVNGYRDLSEPAYPVGGMEVIYRAWYRGWGLDRLDVYNEPLQSSNATDRDGQRIHNGDFRYYRDRYTGRSGKGQVWNDGNNMWIVIINDHSYTRLGAGSLTSQFPGRERRYQEGRQREAEALRSAISKQDFLRAAKIQAHLDRTYKLATPRVGELVRIQSERYHGKGKVVDFDATGVNIDLELNPKYPTHVRWFERGTVSPL